MVVRDTASGQYVKIEAHGANAVRVRAIPTGGSFYDAPDVISALLMPSEPTSACLNATLAEGGRELTSGNLKAAVGADGKLSFTRVSDGRTLLTEKAVRVLKPTTTIPPVNGFLSLDIAFEAVAGEKIFGLGQHAAFPWDKDFPPNGQVCAHY